MVIQAAATPLERYSDIATSSKAARNAATCVLMYLGTIRWLESFLHEVIGEVGCEHFRDQGRPHALRVGRES